MSLELLITNIGFGIAIVISLSMGIFVLVRDSSNEKNIVFFILNLCVVAFEVSHVFGINIADPYISQSIFLLNELTIFVTPLSIHLLLSVLNKTKEKKKVLIFLYIVSLMIFIPVLIVPDKFMMPSRPLFYFLNYYNPGYLHYVGDFYYYTTMIYFFYIFIKYFRSSDNITKNRLRFFLFAAIYGYALGTLVLLPLYGVPVDPFLSAFFWFHTILLAYAVFKHDLVDIHIVAKRALLYTIGIALVSSLIILLNMVNNIIAAHVAYFPILVWPVIAGLIIVSLSHFVWKKFREADILKYEFITVVTHKFRTPLTYIKWSVENLRTELSESEKEENLKRIETASTLLVELTNILVETAKTEGKNNEYNKQNIHLEDLIKYIIEVNRNEFEEKKITVNYSPSHYLPTVSADKKKLLFVLQVMFENAINYTPEGEAIKISLGEREGEVILAIKDKGMGISKEDLPMVFEKFFRGTKARITDTEGMGMSLFIAKNIIERHGGRIWAESGGKGTGSTFYIALKRADK